MGLSPSKGGYAALREDLLRVSYTSSMLRVRLLLGKRLHIVGSGGEIVRGELTGAWILSGPEGTGLAITVRAIAARAIT